jgi:DNA-binding MurR/RpiR family transcriptional regulator
MPPTPPYDPDALRAEISARYDTLSKRLQQIARFALDHPTDMALETIAVIASRAGVQPSALIRFAKAFGYSGFSDMQRIFQTRLLEHAPSYSERIRALRKQRGDIQWPSPLDVLRELGTANIIALEHLQEEVGAEYLEQAIELLAGRLEIYIIGLRRSFPVAAYLAYTLSHFDRNIHFLDGIGGMLFEQASTLSDQDVLIAVTSHPYAGETLEIAALAAEKKVPIIAITDSPVSPIANYATVLFEVHDAKLYLFRSLTGTMCLAQTLAIGLGIRLDRGMSKKRQREAEVGG